MTFCTSFETPDFRFVREIGSLELTKDERRLGKRTPAMLALADKIGLVGREVTTVRKNAAEWDATN